MDIFQALREDHDIQRALLKNLVETAGDTAKRRYFFEQLKTELSVHANAEERYFYKLLMDSDLTQEKARHSIAEHHEIDELVAQLENNNMESSSWLKIAKQLEHQVTHHLDEEEKEIFQLAGKELSDSEKQKLVDGYQKYMKENR